MTTDMPQEDDLNHDQDAQEGSHDPLSITQRPRKFFNMPKMLRFFRQTPPMNPIVGHDIRMNQRFFRTIPQNGQCLANVNVRV